MTGSRRREEIVSKIKSSEVPVPGKELAKVYDVSRQVIVQDIALIRAAGYDIISTNRGYILNAPHTVIRECSKSVIRMNRWRMRLCRRGSGRQGGKCNDQSPDYGHMEAPLDVASRRNVKEFMEGIHSGKSSPLKNITSNYHYHTVEADSEETLDLIEQVLKEKDYLVSNTP